MQGNFGLLQRVICNVLLNAIKFSPKNAIVRIQLVSNHHQVVLSITNQGAGIARDEQAKLFKRFCRTDSGKQVEGSGLGLYFVHKVAEKHHGAIDVESDLDKLTTFNLSLPVSGE